MLKESKRNNIGLLIAALAATLFLTVGVVSVYFGYFFFNDVQSIRKNGLRTEGVILRYERRGSGIEKMKDMFVVPIVQFQTEDSQSVIVEGKCDNTSILKNICEAGERVEIIYDPKKPEHAIINTFAELWFAPLLLWAVGVGFIIVPPFTILRHYKGRGKN